MFLSDFRKDRDLSFILLKPRNIARSGMAAWQYESKDRSVTRFALDGDASAMLRHDLFHQCQPYSTTFVASCRASFHLGETVEDPV